MACVPNLFVIGAPKCGTTALVAGLSRHSQICVPKKEIRYFDARSFYDFPEDAQIRSIDEYLRYFSSPEAQGARYRVDGSVFNMYSPDSLRDILAMSPDARFVLVLRAPLDAAKSMHLQRLKYSDPRMREVSECFAECWRLLPQRREGRAFPPACRNRLLFRYDLLYRYELYLPYITQLIPAGRLVVVDHADLESHPNELFEALWRFLDVEQQDVEVPRANPSYVVDPTFTSRMGELFVRRTGHIRRALDRLGLPVSRLGKAIMKRPVGRPPTNESRISKVDEEASRFFARSTVAMASAVLTYAPCKVVS